MSRLAYWLCRLLGWHKPSKGFATFDGLSHGSVCVHCGNRILKDSSGDWFVVGPYLPTPYHHPTPPTPGVSDA